MWPILERFSVYFCDRVSAVVAAVGRTVPKLGKAAKNNSKELEKKVEKSLELFEFWKKSSNIFEPAKHQAKLDTTRLDQKLDTALL